MKYNRISKITKKFKKTKSNIIKKFSKIKKKQLSMK